MNLYFMNEYEIDTYLKSYVEMRSFLFGIKFVRFVDGLFFVLFLWVFFGGFRFINWKLFFYRYRFLVLLKGFF